MSELPRTPVESRCPMTGWLSHYCDGLLENDKCKFFETHLSDCETCSAAVDALTDASDATLRAISAAPSLGDDEPEFQRLQSLLLSGAIAAEVGRPSHRLAQPPVDALPYQLGNYELLECIGRGAWGAVYRGRHTKLDQPVAIKVMDTARLSDQLAIDRFLQEAKAAGQLRHPKIVRATDAGHDQGLQYLVMELIAGVDVRRVLKAIGPLRVADACEIVRQAAEALDFAHQQSWIHRDVKPSNLMVTYSGQVQLLDLGIAGRCGDQAVGVDQPLGTAEYMAPEQWSTTSKPGAGVDVFGLGCTLHKLLTGSTPPPGAKHLTLSAVRADAPRGLARLVAQMVSSDPLTRVSSASEVARRLRRWSRGADLAELAIQAAPLSKDERKQLLRSAAEGEKARAVPGPTRRAMLAATAGAAACAVAAPWILAGRAPRLRRGEWRALETPEYPVWFQAGRKNACRLEKTVERCFRVEAEALSLVQLGRAISGPFSLRVSILQREWRGGVGLFFRGQKGADKECGFHLIEIRPADDLGNPFSRRLLWSDWEAVFNPDGPSLRRTPLAEASVELKPNAVQTLEVTLGRRGSPVVSWNRETLLDGAWLLSSAGRKLAGRTPAQFRRECLGYLGLATSQGVTDFITPELSYLS